MPKATEEVSTYPPPLKLTAAEIQSLADRLLSRAISKVSIDRQEVRADMLLASRTLRALLAAYELAAGHPLAIVMVVAEGC